LYRVLSYLKEISKAWRFIPLLHNLPLHLRFAPKLLTYQTVTLLSALPQRTP